MRKILGISAFFHDSAAALIVDGEIIAAAQEERFNRTKNTSVFPAKSIEYCLKEGGLHISAVDGIIFYDKPFLKFERILETHYKNAPKGLISFLKSMPSWSDQKLFLKRTLRREIKKLYPEFPGKQMIYFSSHHLSHASSAFYPSPFDEAAILVCDAVGEWTTSSIMKGEGAQITPLMEMSFPDSVGLLYSAFTYFLGFAVMKGEYKLMGLSPYGEIDSSETKAFIDQIRSNLVDIKEDGSISINRSFFTYEVGLKMINDRKWEQLFGVKKRNRDDKIEQVHCNLALAIQQVTEEIIIRMATTAKKIRNTDNLCMAGGVALNCVINGKLQEKKLFKNIWIQPAAGDAGGALGAAMGLYYSQNKRVSFYDKMKMGFLGPKNTEQDVLNIIHNCTEKNYSFNSERERNEFVADQLVKGKVIGWVQGRLEFGPRALGGRSILALPSIDDMQRHLNLSIKFREDFRPFAPVMLKEEALKYFNFDQSSDYMQFVHKICPEYRISAPKNYHTLTQQEKLATRRSDFQATTHVDYSSRLQIVTDEGHPLYDLLVKIRELTGDGILVNTSFNTNGEPIVNTVKEAYECFKTTKISTLVIGNHAIVK